MNPEKRVCQNCKKQFTIEPEDFEFYEKIAVPPPTWCPECRIVRRGQFRNEWNFYKRPCGLCQKDMITIYPPSVSFPAYCQQCYWSDAWDPLKYGKEYDFSVNFFEQYRSLAAIVPRIAIMNVESVDSPYTHLSAQNKNCYLLVESSFNENLQYGYWMQKCRDSFDNAFGTNVELSYETIASFDSNRLFFSYGCFECSDSWFLRECTDCRNCFGCVNLKHKKYCFLNEQLSKEEYEQRIKALNLHSWSGMESAKKMVAEFHATQPNRFAAINNCINSTGNYMTNSKNCRNCFYCMEAEDSRYSLHILNNIKDCYDVDTAGMNASLLYETMNTALSVQRVQFSNLVWTGHDIFYSENLVRGSSNCFGCISLNKKSYCILNTQYSKEEYLALVPRIIEQMKQMPYEDRAGHKYAFGEFFPPTFSPFWYNQTIAQDYFPLTEVEAKRRGYRWISMESKDYAITIDAADLPDEEQDFSKYANQIIGCFHKGACADRCTKAYRLTSEELTFYERMSLPIPRLCPNCRHSARFNQVSSCRLWNRSCDCAGSISKDNLYQNKTNHFHQERVCSNTFETSYSPGRQEIVYCVECYQAEIA